MTISCKYTMSYTHHVIIVQDDGDIGIQALWGHRVYSSPRYA
jgi:hypothetical protein